MTAFDDRFADRVREAFDAYEEPVDERALERLQAALGTAGALAPDRPAVPRSAVPQPRWRGLSVLAALLVASALWLAVPDREPPTDRLGAAVTTTSPDLALADPVPLPEAAPLAEASPAPEAEPATAAQAAPPRDPATPPPPTRPALPRPETVSPGRMPTSAPGAPVAVALPTERFAALPPAPAVLRDPGLGPVREAVAARPLRLGALVPESDGVHLIVASGVVGSGDGVAEGTGVAAGVSHEWDVRGRVSVSGGALLAYGRSLPANDTPSLTGVFADLEDDPGETVEVPTRSVLTTVAVEVPLDVAVDVVRTPRGRVRASVGLTSALYLDQTFEDEGTRYASERVRGASGESVVVLSSESYASEESVGVLGRLDLGRQLNLGLGVAGASPRALGVDVYVRLPLGGVTSRDLPLTVVGVRLRAPLP